MNVDNFDPAIGLPAAAILWAIWLVLHLRERRRNR
jgi:hypothetical protein